MEIEDNAAFKFIQLLIKRQEELIAAGEITKRLIPLEQVNEVREHVSTG